MFTENTVKTTKEESVLAKSSGYCNESTINESVVPLAAPRKYEIVYQNVVLITFFHISALYGLFLFFTSAKTATWIFTYWMYIFGGFGITGGAHRLWAHRTYKAKFPFEVFAMICNCIAYQQTVIYWARDHRLHHKYSDTDADPHNARRGFFFSHIGWLFVRKNDFVKERGKTIDISDLKNNPILKFQEKYAIPLFSVFCFIIPSIIPVIFWGETLNNAWHINVLRYILKLNAALLVNSFAHLYGYKPYDTNIKPTQNLFVSFVSAGEGFHNYHHTFPWDYRSAEIGNNLLNPTTWALDIFARLGWIYDLKTVKPDMVMKKVQKAGDSTNCWGFKQ